MSIFDNVLASIPKPGDMLSSKDMLRRAIAAAQTEIATFMLQKQRLISLEGRAGALSRLERHEAAATVLLSRARALGSNQEAIEREALRELAAANKLKDQLENDPFWQQIMASNWSALGTAPLSKIRDTLKLAAGLTSSLSSLSQRGRQHVRDVAQLERDLVDVENAAQGKGLAGVGDKISGGFDRVTGFYKSMLDKPLMILAAGAAIWAFGPSFAARMSSARRNPARRRRR